MAVKLGEAVVYLIGDQKGIEGDLKDTEKKTEGWAKSLAGKVSGALGTAVKVGVAGVAAGVVGLGTAAFAAGMQLDEAIDTIATSTGAVGPELDGLRRDFEAVFTSIPTEAGPAADTISELNRRLGLTGPELQDVSRNVLEMSRLLGGDAKNNAALLTRVMGDWGVANEDAAGTLDKIFVAGQKTGASVEGLMQKVVQFGSPLRLMGFTLDESIALFAKWEKEGVNAELVMGSLRIAAGEFAREGVDLKEGLRDTIAEIQGMEDASAALALGMQVFGARAGPDMVAAIREGRFAAEDLIAAMQGAEGSILETADATADFPEKFQVFKNVIATSLAPLGLALMNIVTTLLERLAPAVQRISAFIAPLVDILVGLIDTLILGEEPLGDWSVWWDKLASVFGEEIADKISNAVTWIQTIARTIAEFVTGTLIPFIQENGIPILAGLGTVLLAVVIPAFISWAAAAATAAAATIAAILPVAAPVLAIAAVVALLAKAWTSNWGDIQGKTAAVVTWIQNTVGAFLALLQAWWEEHGEEVMATVTVIWDTIQKLVSTAVAFISGVVQGFLNAVGAWWAKHGEQVLALVGLLWEGIRNIVQTVTTIISNIFLAFLALIRGDWDAFGAYLTAAWQAFWEGLKTHVEVVMKLISGIITLAWDSIKDYFATVWVDIGRTFRDSLQWIYDRIAEIWDKIKAPLDKVYNNFRNFWAKLFDNIHIKTPHFSVKWQDVFGVKIPTGVSVKWYGMGGDFMVYGPTLLGVGERGPERVIIQPSGAGAAAETMGVARGGAPVDMDPTNGLLGQILANMRALVAGVQALQPERPMDARALARQLEFEARVSR